MLDARSVGCLEDRNVGFTDVGGNSRASPPPLRAVLRSTVLLSLFSAAAGTTSGRDVGSRCPAGSHQRNGAPRADGRLRDHHDSGLSRYRISQAAFWKPISSVEALVGCIRHERASTSPTLLAELFATLLGHGMGSNERPSLLQRASTYEDQARADSLEIDERVEYVDSIQALKTELEAAGNRLVIVEVMSEVCDTGLFDMEDDWNHNPQKVEEEKQAACMGIKHALVRMAGESPSARFLEVLEDSTDPSELSKWLGVDTFPSIVFFKDKKMVWKIHGSQGMKGDLAEALYYFDGSNAQALPPSEHVGNVYSNEELDHFINTDNNSMLKVVMATTPMCSPCIHVFPSFVSLAASFQGLVQFARVEGDESKELDAVFRRLNILEVPAFVFFLGGREVDRIVSGNRGDLIGHILQVAMRHGIEPPRPKRR